MINRINKFDNKQKEFEVESHMEAENNENYAIKRDTLKMQYDALTNNWRHFNTIIWGVPAVAVAIMSGILVGAYSKDINNWPAYCAAQYRFFIAICFDNRSY